MNGRKFNLAIVWSNIDIIPTVFLSGLPVSSMIEDRSKEGRGRTGKIYYPTCIIIHQSWTLRKGRGIHCPPNFKPFSNIVDRNNSSALKLDILLKYNKDFF